MFILDYLFGKKKFVEIPKIGVFEARVRNHNVKKNTWVTTISIKDYADEIVIILDGDANAPEKKQVESVIWIIENLKEIDKEVIAGINRNRKLTDKFNKYDVNDLRLSDVNPYDAYLNSYDVSYSLKSNEEIGVSVIIQNNKVLEIE